MKDLRKNSRLEEIRRSIPKETKREVEKLHAIADRIFELLKKKGIDQSNLAKSLGKYESEISKWMAGQHNFTIQSILNIEAVLGEDIIQIPKKENELDSDWKRVSSRLEKLKALSRKLQSNSTHRLVDEDVFKVAEPIVFYFPDKKYSNQISLNISDEGNWKNKEEFEQGKTV